MAYVKNLKIEEQNNSNGLLYATWSMSSKWTKNLSKYKIYWYYATGDGVWFSGSNEEIARTNSTYTPPENATQVKVKVKPISKKDKKNKSIYTGTYKSKIYKIYTQDPADPTQAPTIEDKTTATQIKIKATCTTSDDLADRACFFLYRYSTKKKKYVEQLKKYVDFNSQNEASASFNLSYANANYKVRYKVGNRYSYKNKKGKTVTTTNWNSKFSPYSDAFLTRPHKCKKLKAKLSDDTSVQLTWKCDTSTGNYEIEYTDNKQLFGQSSGVSSETSNAQNALIQGLELGKIWYFRVRAVHKTTGREGKWSDIISTRIGKKPQPPTTWASTTRAKVGETIKLYWTHNAEDQSDQRNHRLCIVYDSGKQLLYTYDSGTAKFDGWTVKESSALCDNPDDDNPIYYRKITLTEECTFTWWVRTKGVHADWSERSVEREVKVYEEPTLEISLSDIGEGVDDDLLIDLLVDELPLSVELSAGPETQTPVNYYISISATKDYSTDNEVGEEIHVCEGDVIYSKIFNVKDNPLTHDISAGDISLEDGQEYKVHATVLMDSGLKAEADSIFIVEWADKDFIIDASVNVDPDTLTATIQPRCIVDDDLETDTYVDNVALSVYRREYNGEFTLLDDSIQNDGYDTVVDPHPALDYARYRVVARASDGSTTKQGLIYEDIPGEPVGEKAIVINWDETWSNFDYSEDEDPVEPPWSGSMLRLPYNVDVNEKPTKNVTHVSYIGRVHPVSYYGVARAEEATWSTVIPKTDKETIYNLRRLAVYDGDVYVREPSGVGYWATITVGMDIKHKSTTIPVTFEIKRVDGTEEVSNDRLDETDETLV